jgi:hypothetical protein
MEYAQESVDLVRTDKKILNLLRKNSLSIEYAHAVYALDIARMEKLSQQIEDTLLPLNLADFSCCYSWYKPILRNLPKFLFELVLDARNDELIGLFLAKNCDVNLPNSKTGWPFYFYAFHAEFREHKGALLKNSNLTVKNQHGQTVLFHLVDLYLEDFSSSPHHAEDEQQHEGEECRQCSLVDDFNSLLRSSPLLITCRDGKDTTLIEYILLLSRQDSYRRAAVFLREISKFTLELVETKKLKVFQEMIYHSYGLVLLNTPVFNFTHDTDDIQQSYFQTLTLEQYVMRNNVYEMKSYIRKFFDADFFKMIGDFFAKIKMGDVSAVKSVLALERNYFLIKFRDYSGRTCLHVAVLYGQKMVTKY